MNKRDIVIILGAVVDRHARGAVPRTEITVAAAEGGEQ